METKQPVNYYQPDKYIIRFEPQKDDLREISFALFSVAEDFFSTLKCKAKFFFFLPSKNKFELYAEKNQ